MEPASCTGGTLESVGDHAIFGIVTISDRASTGVYQDEGGPAILGFFNDAIHSSWEARYRLIADEQGLIESTLKTLVRITCSMTACGIRVTRLCWTPDATSQLSLWAAPP